MSMEQNYFQRISSIVSTRSLCVLFLPLLLAGCGGSYSSTPPSVSTAKAGEGELATAPVHTTDAKIAYVFSNDIVTAEWPGKENTCGKPPDSPPRNCEDFYVGNPVYTYSVDLVSGMATSIGITADLTLGNAKSTATAPSDNFLYILSADKAGNGLVYTFSIGYLTFTLDEFKSNKLDPLGLYNELVRAGYTSGTVVTSEQIVDKLIAVIEDPAFYDRISAKNPDLTATYEIRNLTVETANIRVKRFSELTYNEKKSIVNLNRLLLELVYPQVTPKNKGMSALHVVGPPVKGPMVSTYASLHVEPFGQFVYALSSSSSIYSTVLKAYVPGLSLAVYSIDQSTGTLTSVGIQAFDIGQLIFAPSGKFAYGSDNGSIHTYSINRTTGLFTEIGTPAPFEAWVVGNNFHSYLPPPLWHKAPAFHNMAADASGKFLFVLGQRVQQFLRYKQYEGCVIPDDNSIGSLIYTFIIDKNTGLLTQSGPPFETAPNTMTWGSVDPQGRFIQLLNTHEFDPGIWDDGCPYGVSPITPGYIHSYYVDQNSGKLFPSGSLAAGGSEIPTGFVNAGTGPISLTGNDSGGFLYLLNQGNMFYYEVDQADGAITTVGSPLTGATETVIPGVVPKPLSLILPNVCYLPDSTCTVNGYRPHSITWAGY